ncbi:hypothetical protein NP233_g3217 [Leucocoprinus birnbaumii]|uniref:glutathione transferase n=1 Tax=Leucocoprinus birnbaumii TaxID=56174 RepID=A0AAD5VZN7_9AGAR|nr:hypothetical protein NP233_g3217 [Leucocoprinus birnbaumii]
MVLKLHSFPNSPNVTRVAVILHEKKVPFELVNVSLAGGENKTPDYLAKQPFGQVPYLEDDGFIIYESWAIARYICEKYRGQGPDLVPPATDLKKRALFEQAASTEVANFQPNARAVVWEGFVKTEIYKQPADSAKLEEAKKALEAKLDVYEAILSKQKYLAGDELTLADFIHLGYGSILPRAGCNALHDAEKRPNVARWFKGCDTANHRDLNLDSFQYLSPTISVTPTHKMYRPPDDPNSPYNSSAPSNRPRSTYRAIHHRERGPTRRLDLIYAPPPITAISDGNAGPGSGSAGNSSITNELPLSLVHTRQWGYSGNGYYIPRFLSVQSQQNIFQGISMPENADPPQGPFTNAHDFIIQDAKFINFGISTEEWRLAEEQRRAHENRIVYEAKKARDEERAERIRRAEEERLSEETRQTMQVLEDLATRGLPSSMLDAKEREYAPRCSENTRQLLRGRIVDWGRNDTDVRRLLWLSGPAAVGKSAVAQTVAEEFKTLGLLGGVFFFSRPNHRSDPDVVIPTLVYQLALLFPDYRQIISRRLSEDPTLLSRSRRSQFKELIIDPLLALPSHKRILIVIDGLDECSSREAQCELVEMISHYAYQEQSLRLCWMICSRPEPHLVVAFSSPSSVAVCKREKLEINDIEGQSDARCILEHGFAAIKRRYPDQLTADWPDEDDVHFIASRVMGHLGVASFLIRFIGDMEYDDPSGQLQVCLRFLKGAGGSAESNPLHALDLLYSQILSDIAQNILSDTQRILGVFIFHSNENIHRNRSRVALDDNVARLPVIVHANFLGLTQAAFYRALQRLHSLVFVPPASESEEKSIQIYHASFSDFLADPARSKRFTVSQGVVDFDVASRGLHWLQYARRNPGILYLRLPIPFLTMRSTDTLESLIFPWIPPSTTSETMLEHLLEFSFSACWNACSRVGEENLPELLTMLLHFDFDLDYVKWWKYGFTEPFAYFIRRLLVLVSFESHVGCGRPALLIVCSNRAINIEHLSPSILKAITGPITRGQWIANFLSGSPIWYSYILQEMILIISFIHSGIQRL